jgi:hypothetical protein
MEKISALVHSRTGILALVLVVAAGVFSLLPPAEARQICGFRPTIRTYYNDANHDVEVGQRGIDCGCNPVLWGTTSSFVVVTELCCTVNTC